MRVIRKQERTHRGRINLMGRLEAPSAGFFVMGSVWVGVTMRRIKIGLMMRWLKLVKVR